MKSARGARFTRDRGRGECQRQPPHVIPRITTPLFSCDVERKIFRSGEERCCARRAAVTNFRYAHCVRGVKM